MATDGELEGVEGWQTLFSGSSHERCRARCSCTPHVPPHRAYVFRAQSAEMKERGGNQTSGIDFFITQERIVFLDTQVPAWPLLPGP